MSGFDQFGQQTPGQPQPYGTPQQQPASNRGAKVGLALSGVALLLLGVCIVGCGWNLFFGDREEPEARPTAAAPASRTPTASPSPEFEPRQGRCVRNDGTDSRPDLQDAPCGPGTYKIVASIPGTTDAKACDGPLGATEPYDAAYTYTSASRILKYTLCLKKQ
ncbi:hypothetical protein [Catellatospora sp. NPDC049609]|uniref:LppU/SCO3897 family protein n=1 Tax=Catellatospora sp. NPDC049609 TaxID=3155505 RepID=UPI00341F8AA2